MIEAYWSWSACRTLLATSDVQLYLQPALSPANQVASVFTIRRALLWSGEIEVPDTHLQRRPGPVAQLVGGRLGSWVRGLAVILGTMPP